MTDMTGKYRLWIHASAEQGKHDSETAARDFLEDLLHELLGRHEDWNAMKDPESAAIVVTANKGVESGW